MALTTNSHQRSTEVCHLNMNFATQLCSAFRKIVLSACIIARQAIGRNPLLFRRHGVKGINLWQDWLRPIWSRFCMENDFFHTVTDCLRNNGDMYAFSLLSYNVTQLNSQLPLTRACCCMCVCVCVGGIFKCRNDSSTQSYWPGRRLSITKQAGKVLVVLLWGFWYVVNRREGNLGVEVLSFSLISALSLHFVMQPIEWDTEYQSEKGN